MKNLLFVSAALALSTACFAQTPSNIGGNKTLSQSDRKAAFTAMKMPTLESSLGKSTGNSDSFYYVSTANYIQLFTGDSAAFYVADAALPADSGAYFGTNVYGADAFGEWFFIDNYGGDTTIKIVGAVSWFGGTVQPQSTKTINVKLWNVDTVTQTPIQNLPPNNYLIETPGTQIYSQPNIPITNLMIDTALTFTYFTTGQTISGAFFLGYDINYQWANLAGDTIGLFSTRAQHGWDHYLGYVDTSTVNDDTLIYAQTVRHINNEWVDVLGFDANMSMVPIFVFEGANVWPTSVASVVKNGLSLFGNYPNPATNSTNIKFSLDKASDVTIRITDITGRIVSTVTESNLGTGEHTIPVQTAGLATGSYVYMISTSNGAALAAQFSVVN